MMFPSPWQMVMIGYSVSEMQNADQGIRIQSLERFAHDLENRSKSVLHEYEGLWNAYNQLKEHATAVEIERDELRNQFQTLAEHSEVIQAQCDQVVAEFKSFKEVTENWVRANATKIDAFDVLKKLLETMLDNADRVFTSEVTSEHRQKIRNFLNQLPE
ncbi:MAG TPA: hypothetical protein PK250_07575 [Syntrophobacter fumaroxidans]|nr:hypothetical protein [Syntrophobacter fumaroxidans]